MLKGLRKAGQSWVGKTVVFVLFGLLILSFAVWGIGDIFRGAPRNTVAVVGSTEISAEQFRTAYQTELQRITRQSRRNLTPEQARLIGLPNQILSRLVTEAVLDERARTLGLTVSDQTVARAIFEDPNFKGGGSQFDRALFDATLRENGLTEQAFVREQRAVTTRLQLAEAISGALSVPLAAREAVHRYGAERRAAAYLVVPAAAVGEIPAATPEQLQAFYDDRKTSFRAPEYRSFNTLTLTPEALVRPEAVSDDDARRGYEQAKGRFGTVERRTIQQIVFPSAEEAAAASERIRQGTTFEALAQERNLAAGDLTLGTFARAEIVDPAVAEAAFALSEGAASGPVQGRFGTVLVRVTAVEAASAKPFEEVAAELKREIATERARSSLNDVHDAIEDLRASARPLADIAREKSLALVAVPGLSRSGEDKGGARPDLPEREALLTAVFASEIGADTEALRTRAGGYVWYEVTNIEAARDRPFEDVREAVAAQWRSEQVSRLLADRARALVERLDKGETIETLAAETGKPAQTGAELARNTAKDELTADAVNRIFATPVGKASSVAAGDQSRTVFKVTTATVPPFLTTTQEAARVEEQLRLYISDDLLAQYIAQIQKDIGVRIDQQAVQRVLGGET